LRVAVAAMFVLCACPGLAAVDVKTTPPRAPGEPFVLDARVTIKDLLKLQPEELPRKGFSGRARLGVRAPSGWTVHGRYQLDGTTYDLMPAPMVAKELSERGPEKAGERWFGFVTHLHTGLAADTPVELVLFATPPAAARGDAELAIVAGPAPHYPRWQGVSAPRIVKLGL